MIPSCETAALFHKGVHRRDVSLFNADCLDVLKDLASHTVDALVTSPPYDNLRTYNGYSFDFEAIAAEIYRVTKPGGVIVWVINDATVKGSETGTSFRQALYFMSLGFIFSKKAPKVVARIEDRKNKWGGSTVHGTGRQKDGSTKALSAVQNGLNKKVKEYGVRHNVWDIANPGKAGNLHPATFPLQLAIDHIQSWSNPGDIVLDPFLGSGTTGEAAVALGRQFIGIEISQEYFDIASARLTIAVGRMKKT